MANKSGYPCKGKLFVVLIAALVSACSSKSYFAEAEEALDTSDFYHVLDHASNYYPSAISLSFPGYIVSFEETSRARATRSPNDLLFDESKLQIGFTIKRLLKQLRYDVPFVSQVMRYQGRPFGEGNCSLYSLYHRQGSALVDHCEDAPPDRNSADYDYGYAFVRSWDAIDVLRESLIRDVSSGKYNQVIIGVMGLDTPQQDAIRNYESIISSIRKQAGEDFRPLFIGITWPSFFANRWFDPLWESLAYPPIADRADILGLTWLGILFNDVFMPLGEHLPVNVISHSLGARATSMAICVGSALLRPGDEVGNGGPGGKIHMFVGLAPAFTLRRFIDEDRIFYETVYYADYCPMIDRFVFTASSNDEAFAPMFWSDAVGDHDAMIEFCRQEQQVEIFCTAAREDGSIESYATAAKLVYIDTSDLMKYAMPGTKGGGHSDIFRREIGRMVWQLLDHDYP